MPAYAGLAACDGGAIRHARSWCRLDTQPYSGGVADPLTGHLAHRPGQSHSQGANGCAAAAPQLVYTPHKEYQLFQGPPGADKIVGKICELNGNMAPDMRLSEAEAGSKAAELPFHAPNVWPDPASAPLFKPAFTAYRDALLTVRDK